MIFTCGDREYGVEIVRKNNKNTYVRVRDGKIYVTTNYFTCSGTINKLLKDNYKAIGKMIDRAEKREEKKELFLLFGKHYDVVYGDFDRPVIFEDGCIKVINEKTLCKWLDKFIHTTYYNHLMYWYDEFEEDIPIPNIKIRKMKTRWGVCNTNNHNVTLNLELFRYNIECLDYVIVHELAHFLEPNHSKRFWKVVEKYCPNYRETKKKLKG